MLVLATATPAQAPTGSGTAATAEQARTASWHEHRPMTGAADATDARYGTPVR
ncbi:hypothetical protein [Thermomonospora echinospora]|uniref:hypothetical protein n=1 Tax=Thermomonospora echinospora TaxID=1992 RepID=UPI0013589341|nr:hypothetical protein [Thermomonospora echinospora]